MGKERIRLKVLRAQNEVTQMDVARSSSMNVTRYWQIENGEGLPVTGDEQKAVAAALGVKVTDIAWPEFEKAQAS